MFRSTTIIKELQCPCQSHYYLNTVVCTLKCACVGINNLVTTNSIEQVPVF